MGTLDLQISLLCLPAVSKWGAFYASTLMVSTSLSVKTATPLSQHLPNKAAILIEELYTLYLYC